MVRCRRSMLEAAARVFMPRSYCAGVNVGTTAAAPSGLGSKSVSTPLLETSVHFSTCSAGVLTVTHAPSQKGQPSRQLMYMQAFFIRHSKLLRSPFLE